MFSPFKSIHIKVIFWTLLPSFFVMGVLSVLSLVTIKNTALEVVQERDAELAEMTAKRLSENLSRYPLFLQTLADTRAMKTMDFSGVDPAIARTRNWLHFFDGGIFLYDPRGAQVWSYPGDTFYREPHFPDLRGFKTISDTLRPYYSDILFSGGRGLILIAVPILGPDNGMAGVVAGVCSLDYSTLGTTYTKVLEYKSGQASYAYLVDGHGRVLYHRQPSLMGRIVLEQPPVKKVVQGLTGAMVTPNVTGQKVISGYAPVPGTGWGIVTQGNWSLIQNLIRFYTRYSLVILWGGGIFFALVVSFFMQRLLEPVRDLTQGAAQIANGHFIEIPVKKTGDEIEVLSRQFNSMARAMKASFGAIHGRIDELNRAQIALKQSEEKIRGIINAVNDVMLMVDDSGTIRWINDKARRVMGDQAEGAPYYKPLYRQSAPPEDCIVSACFADGVENDTEIQLWNQGKYQDFWLTANVVQRDKTGKVTRVVVVCRNLTEKKRLRAEVLRNAQLAALGELAAGVAHEINNPINGIINYAQIVEDVQALEQDHPHAQLPGRIIKEAERIAIIVSKLLSFARAGTEKKEAVALPGVLEDALDLTRAALRKEHIQVEMHLPPDLPPCRAVIHQVQQIFLNIIGNARHALNQKFPGSDTGKKLVITCSVVQGDVPMVRTEFKDYGIGIPKAVMSKICNPFFSTKPPDQGTGLGLSISYGIIEEHDGALDIRSIQGKWTRVSIDLPVWQ